MPSEDDLSASDPDVGLKRRGLLKFGSWATALTGASAFLALGTVGANAAPGGKTPAGDYVPVAEKGAASGVATLDAGSRIPASQLPDLSATIDGRHGVILEGLGAGDDEAKIEAALAQPGVRRVTIPTGSTATVAGLVTVPANKTLVIEPMAVLRHYGATATQPLRLSAGATVTGGGTVDAANLSNTCMDVAGPGATIRGIKLTNAKAYAIQNTGQPDLRVEDCEFESNISYALLNESAGAVRAIFSNNRVMGKRGVMMKSCTDGVISNNIIALDGTGVGIEVFGATAARATVTGNLVTNPSIGISLASAISCAVTGNTVTGAASVGIENAEGASGNIISGNTVADGDGTGIALTSGTGGLKPHAEVVVSGNTVCTMGKYGIQTEYGCNTNINGNTIVDTGSYPIFCNNSPRSMLIASNVIRQVLGLGNGAIRLTGTGHLIQGNHVDYTMRADLAGTEGIRIEGGSKHLVAGNYFRGMATGIAINNSAGAVVNNNRTEGTTTAAVKIYGAASVSAVVLTHISTLAGGVVVADTSAATITGPLINVA